MLKDNIEMLAPCYKKIGVDAYKFVDEYKGVIEYEEKINSKFQNEPTPESYYANNSGANHIHNVTTPTLVYFT